MRFPLKNKVIPVLFLFVSLIFISGMGRRPSVVQGTPAPDFTLSDLNGKQITLSDFKGKPILLNFWASWCKPCVLELPEIEAAYNANKDKNFIILGINVGENEKEIRKFINETNLTFPILSDEKGNTAALYSVNGMPVSFFIDEDGLIMKKVFGGGLTKKKIEEEFGFIDN